MSPDTNDRTIPEAVIARDDLSTPRLLAEIRGKQEQIGEEMKLRQSQLMVLSRDLRRLVEESCRVVQGCPHEHTKLFKSYTFFPTSMAGVLEVEMEALGANGMCEDCGAAHLKLCPRCASINFVRITDKLPKGYREWMLEDGFVPTPMNPKTKERDKFNFYFMRCNACKLQIFRWSSWRDKY